MPRDPIEQIFDADALLDCALLKREPVQRVRALIHLAYEQLARDAPESLAARAIGLAITHASEHAIPLAISLED